MKRTRGFQKTVFFTAMILPLFFAGITAVFALPEGESVAEGSATFDRSEANTLKISTPSDKVIINYNSFNIGAGEYVYFYQPSASSAALNRVLGQDFSSIMGTLEANGIIYLINPNGIYIGSGASIKAAGFIASTLNIADPDFMSGNQIFTKWANKVGKSVLNNGYIRVQEGGQVVLLGSAVANAGTIETSLGRIVLAAGEKITLNLDTAGMISVVIDEPVKEEIYGFSGEKLDSAVQNSGTINNPGGKVILAAKALNHVFDYAINNSGVIQANSLTSHDGVVELIAEGAPVLNSGRIEAGEVRAKLKDADLVNTGEIIARAQEGASVAGSIYIDIQSGDILQGGRFIADSLIDLKAAGVYQSVDPLVLGAGLAAAPDFGVVIQAPQVKVSARYFGTAAIPLAIQAGRLYIDRIAGAISILESVGIGSSVLVRGPPDGFGAVLYNKDAKLSLTADLIELVGSGSVYFYGDITFSSLYITAAGKEIYFEAGRTYTVLGALKIEGAYAQYIKLLSSQKGAYWYFDPQGQRDIRYAWVEDSYNISPEKIYMVESTNRGHAFNWDPTATWTGAVSTLWSVAGNWSGLGGGAIPGAGDDVIIPSGSTVVVDIDAEALSLTINNSGAATSLSINAGKTLTVGGAVVLSAPSANGTTTLDVGAGTLLAASLSITGGSNNSRIAQVTVSTGTITVTGNITLTGTAVRALLTSSGASTINVGGDFGLAGAFSAGTGTVKFNGSGAQVVGAYTYYNLNIEGSGTKTLDGTTTVSNNLVIASGATLSLNATLSVSGLTDISGTLTITGTTGTKAFNNITINSGGAFTFSANEPIAINGNLQVDGSSSITTGTGVWTFQKAGGGGTISGTAASISITSATFATSYANSATLVIGTLTINSGVTFTNNAVTTVTTAIAGGTGTFTQGASATFNIADNAIAPTLDATASGNTVNYNGSGNQTVKATTYYNLKITSTGGTVTIPTAVVVNNDFTIVSGTAGIAAVSVTFNGATSISGTLNITGTSGTKIFAGLVTINSGGTWNNSTNTAITFRGGITNNGSFTAGAGIYTFDTNAQAVGGANAITIPNLTVTGIVLTNNGTLSVATALSGTGSLVQASGAVLNIGGTATITTLVATASGNTVNYNGAAQTIKAVTYHHLTVSGSGIKTLGGSIVVNGNLLVSAGTLTPAGFSVTGSGTNTLSVTGIIQVDAATFSGNYASFETITLNSGSTVDYSGTIAQAIDQTLSYQNLTISGSNTKSLSGATSVAGNLTISAGTLSAGSNTLTISGNWTGAGTFSAGTGTVEFIGTSAQTIGSAATTFYNLVINKASNTATFGADVVVSNNLTITSGTLDTSNRALSVSGATSISGTLAITTATGAKTFGDLTVNSGGTFDNSGNRAVTINGSLSNSGTFTAGTNTYTLAGSGKSISGVISFTNLTVNGTYTNNGTLSIATALAGSGTLTQGSGATLNIGDAAVAAGLTIVASASGNTVNYNRAGNQTLEAITYYYLTVSGSGVKTLSGDIIVLGNLTIGSGVTLDVTASDRAITVGGDWSNSGTFTARQGTVTFNTAAASTISGNTTFYNFTSTTAGKTISFASGSTQTIQNILTLTGASGNLITLARSGGSGSDQWNINVTGTSNVSFVSVSNSNASGNAITASNAVNGGNNTNWFGDAVSYLQVTGSASMTAGASIELSITAYDVFGNIFTGYAGTKALTFSGLASSPSGSVPQVEGVNVGSSVNILFVAGVSSAGAATLVAYKAESATLNVSDGSVNSNSSHGLSLTVSPAAANYLAITGSASMTAGASNELTITAYDLYGNIATGYSGTKSLTFSGLANAPAGNVPQLEGVNLGSSINVIFTAGVSNANAATLVAYKAESATVNVSDGSVNSNASHGLSLTVSPGAAVLAFIRQPSDTAFDALIIPAITVRVSEPFGNPINSGSAIVVTLAFSVNPSGGVLSGTLTKTASGGIATFNDIRISVPGAGYSFLASSAGLSGVVSGTFSVTGVLPASPVQISQLANTAVSRAPLPDAVALGLYRLDVFVPVRGPVYFYRPLSEADISAFEGLENRRLR